MSDGSILPVVRYADPAEAAGWLCSAYGLSIHHVAKRPDGGTAYIVLRFGENSVIVASHGSSAFDDLMVQPADVGNRSTQTCYLTVQDVDQHYAQALMAGARIEVEPSDDGIGGRFYMCRDQEGHLWSFGAPLVGSTPAGPDGPPSEQPRRRPALSARASTGLAVLVGVAVGCGAMFYLGTDLAPKSLTAWIGGIRGQSALSSQLEQDASASAAKRLLVSEAALLGLAEKLQISQSESAEAQQSRRNASKLLSPSETEYLSQLKDSRGALDAAVRAKELASQELEVERRRAQVIQRQLDEVSQQLARLRADGSTVEVEARRPSDASGQTGDASPGATQAGETERGQLATAQNTEQLLRERLRASERESRELQLRARMAVLEMDKEAARARAVREAESARTALAASQAKESEPRNKLRTSEPGTADAPPRATAKEAARDVARMPPEPATEVARTAPPDTKVDEVTPRATPRATYFRPLPQHQLTQRKKWISAAAIKKAKAERHRQAAEAAAARKAEEERQRLAAEAAEKAEAERQRQAAEAAAARKAEEELQRLAAEAAEKAEAERQRQAAEAAAARKAEEERQRLAAEAAEKAEAERQRQVAAAAARKAEEERQRLAAEAAQKAEAERQRQVAEAAAAARKIEEERQRLAADAAQKAEVERQRQVAEAAAAARKIEEERQRLAAEAAQKAEAERQHQATEAAAAAAQKVEEERQRLAAEAAQKVEAERIAKETVEAKARADQETRRRTLGLTVTSEDGTRFLARGRALLKTGDVASARLLLERASNAGLADAAMELAETYDPATVARLSAVGLVGDREQARVWYMRAQALGSFAAAERLKSIVGQ
jgi:uncharacterized glyoxalase superfamily protein PhnB